MRLSLFIWKNNRKPKIKMENRVVKLEIVYIEIRKWKKRAKIVIRMPALRAARHKAPQ